MAAVQKDLQESPDDSLSRIIYDRFDCAWLHESLADFDEKDDPTYIQPSRPFVTFDISQSRLKGWTNEKLRELLRDSKGSFVDSTDTLGLNVTFPCRIILKEDAVPRVI